MVDNPALRQHVMFGQSGLLADYVDIIHACGGRLKKVVVNVPDPAAPNQKSFVQRLADINWHLAQLPGTRPIEVEDIGEFQPAPNEHYVIGFRGTQLTGLRDELVRRHRIEFERLIHPHSIVSSTAALGEGVIVCAAAVIASGVEVGEFCLINRGATLGHDCRLAAFARIGPGTNVASNVRIGRGAAIGIGATVIEDLTIGEDAYVAAGAVVIRDVAPHMVVAGVPAEVVKRRDDIRKP